MFQRLNLTIVFVLIGLVSASSRANKVKEFTCYSTIYAPYAYLESGQMTGIDIDIIKTIAKENNLTISFKVLPWIRLNNELRSGKIQCAMAFLKTSIYTQNMVYMDNPITIGEYTVFIKQKNHNTIEKISDLYGKTVAINRGFVPSSTFQKAIRDGFIKKYEVENEQQSLQMLFAERVEGVLTDKYVGLFNLQQLKINGIVPMKETIKLMPVYLVFSPEFVDNGILDIFNTNLKTIKENGTYQKILDKYRKKHRAYDK